MIVLWPERKFNLFHSNLWKGMTEMHCHILPGVDDGVKNVEDALQLLRYMEEEVEVKNVRMTPHTMMDFNNGPSRQLQDKFEHFSVHYSGGLHLSIASEYMLDATFDERLAHEDVLSLGGWDDMNLLLVETACSMPPVDFDGMLDGISDAGYVPVIAHPERYTYMNEWKYIDLLERGYLFQLNIPSLYGCYGDKIKKRAEWLMDKDMYHFAGFDIHRYESYARVIQDLSLTRKRVECLCELLDNNSFIVDIIKKEEL